MAGDWFGYLQMLKESHASEGRLANRVIAVEVNYHPGLDIGVEWDAPCPRFHLFIRPHRPDETFNFCVNCRAPLRRPDRENM